MPTRKGPSTRGAASAGITTQSWITTERRAVRFGSVARVVIELAITTRGSHFDATCTRRTAARGR